jgi:hypothetical protein
LWVNYYPNDGGPTQILNSGDDTVTLAPLPLTGYLVDRFEQNDQDFVACALMTLPFGLKALALLQDPYTYTDPSHTGVETRKGAELLLNAEEFGDEIKGGLQLQLNGGKAFIQGESDMFVGSTVQLNNVLDAFGIRHGDSTLGRTVTKIFNNEFLLEPFDLFRQPRRSADAHRPQWIRRQHIQQLVELDRGVRPDQSRRGSTCSSAGVRTKSSR